MNKLLTYLQEAAKETCTIVGVFSIAIYISGWFGASQTLPWKYENYPIYVIGLFMGFVLKRYLY